MITTQPQATVASTRRAGLLRFAANVSSLTLARVVGDGLSFFIFLVVARTYGIDGTGHYAFAFAWAAFIATVANPGLTDYGIRECARAGAGTWQRSFARVLAVQRLLLVAAILCLVALLVVLRPGLPLAVMISGLSIYLAGFLAARTYFVPAFAREEMTAPSLWELACRAGAVAVVLTLALAVEAPLHIALIGFPIAGLALMLVGLRSARQAAGGAVAPATRQELVSAVREAWPFAATEIVGQIYARAGVILLALLAGAAATGAFATLLKLVEVGTAPLALVVTAGYPRLSRTFHQDLPAFRAGALDVLRFVVLLAGCLALAFCFLLPWLLPLVFGPDFAALRPDLPWIGLVAALQGIEIVFVRLMFASDQQHRVTATLTSGAVLNLLLNLVLVPWLATTGAVVAAVIGIVALCAIYCWLLRRALPIPDQLGVLGRFAASLGLATVAGYAGASAGTNPILDLVLACAVFAGAGWLLGLVPRKLTLA